MCYNEIKNNSDVGKLVTHDMNNGRFVSDEIVNELIKTYIFDSEKKK